MSRRSGTSDGRITPEPIDPEVLAVIRDQPPAPTGATVWDVIRDAVRDADHLQSTSADVTDAVLAALAAKGLVIVELDDLEMAVEWMDQSDNPWSGSETFAETWTAALVAQYELKDVIAAYYAARQPEGETGE